MAAPKFPCTKCGACCRSAENMPKELREGIIVPGPDGACVHLSPDNTCQVYDTRPKACRVDSMKPPLVPTGLWYWTNLRACDRLHLKVYGTKRPVLVGDN